MNEEITAVSRDTTASPARDAASSVRDVASPGIRETAQKEYYH